LHEIIILGKSILILLFATNEYPIKQSSGLYVFIFFNNIFIKIKCLRIKIKGFSFSGYFIKCFNVFGLIFKYVIPPPQLDDAIRWCTGNAFYKTFSCSFKADNIAFLGTKRQF
jgi:hypothetical protein